MNVYYRDPDVGGKATERAANEIPPRGGIWIATVVFSGWMRSRTARLPEIGYGKETRRARSFWWPSYGRLKKALYGAVFSRRPVWVGHSSGGYTLSVSLSTPEIESLVDYRPNNRFRGSLSLV